MEPTSAPTDARQQSGSTPALQELSDWYEQLRLLGTTMSLLAWDERTQMPPKGIRWRARQLALLAGLHHERLTSERTLRLIEAVEEQDASSDEARVVRRDYERSAKLPNEFVREYSEVVTLAGQAWQNARAADDFAGFAPHLQSILELTRRKADYLGYSGERYDALLDIYEEGSTTEPLVTLFDDLRTALKPLIDQQPEPDRSILERHYPEAGQRQVERELVQAMGFDMQAGRIDPTAHPFCITIGEGDVRMTTRYNERALNTGLFSTLHEAGHGVYDQSFARLGLPKPLATAPGLGMHESQSRTFENVIGRSRAFWTAWFPALVKAFPDSLSEGDFDAFVQAVNTVERSLIRVEADELTYNLHIGLRFELERTLINGEMKVQELPEAWHAASQRWLGVQAPSDADGVLQDVHWSGGSFGYFPTYTLGNVYAAQFMQVARRDLPGLDDSIAGGDLTPLRGWLDENIYRHGRRYTGPQFVERITGGPVDATPLIEYLKEKF